MQKLREKLSGLFKDNEFKRIAWGYVLLAVLLNVVIEILSRHSLLKTLLFIITRPHLFIYDALIIFFTMTLSLFFEKRTFVLALIMMVWLVLGLGDGILLIFRKTPLTAQDFANVVEAVRIMPRYLNVPKIILLILLIALLIAIVVSFYFRSNQENPKTHRVRSFALSAWALSVSLMFTMIGQGTGILGTSFGNIAQAYHQYGFVYCFTSSIFGTGVSKPDNYSGEAVEKVLETIETTAEATPLPEAVHQEEHRPNIIFLQLESLFDPTLVKGVTFSEDPIPFLHKLYQNYSSGYLNVPSFGAGTVNTEFEVLTGMNLDDFGPGEYPYKTVLLEKVCESLPFYLKKYDYTTYALHDNAGDFYQRNHVFPQLGFDSFTSLEYMNGYELTPTGWAKDTSLIPEITDMISSTEGRDFIYAISVEGHGDYPEDLTGITLPIQLEDPDNVTGAPEGFRYYVNQIREMDDFVRELVETLEKIDEDVVLVMYGDHLPTFDFTEEEMENGSIFQTRYVIWDNMGLAKQDRDVEAFQLSSLVLERLGLPGDVIYKLHTAYLDQGGLEAEETYLEDLKLLEYDLLYEDADAYDGSFPYHSTMMKMGHRPITIENAENVYTHVTVTGDNFTLQSVVFINGEKYMTVYNGPNELIVPDVQLNNWDVVEVRQVAITANGYLSSTERFRYRTR